MFHSGLSGVPLPGLGLATEWIEIHPLDYTDISPDCLGLATEWIEILIYPLPVYAYNGLGLATEWIEMWQKRLKWMRYIVSVLRPSGLK